MTNNINHQRDEEWEASKRLTAAIIRWERAGFWETLWMKLTGQKPDYGRRP